jgi:predicted nuclease of predicted toxin-antitoxin system
MKFLFDQDVYAVTARYLKALGHEVITANEAGLSKAEDLDLLDRAKKDGRIFVTRDRDFGGLIFVDRAGAGVLYLRILPSNVDAVHKELGMVLNRYQEAELQNAFVVVEPFRHRFRKIG